jgi:hypothetical protein
MSNSAFPIVVAAAAGALGALVALRLSRPSPSDARAVTPTADLDAKIRNAVLHEANVLKASMPGPKVYPEVGKPTKQVRWAGRGERAGAGVATAGREWGAGDRVCDFGARVK